jgi:hypothetical protein
MRHHRDAAREQVVGADGDPALLIAVFCYFGDRSWSLVHRRPSC